MQSTENYDEIAGLFKVLSNPIRLRILDTLLNRCLFSKKNREQIIKGCCVFEINEHLDIPQPYVSKHLKILKDCGILTYRKEGNKIYYEFENSGVLLKIKEYIGKFDHCC